jgi:chorismate mutase
MTGGPDSELSRLRAEVDLANLEIHAALQRRARLCRAIARHKRAMGLPKADPQREQAMLAALPEPGAEGYPADANQRIWRAILQESRRIVEAGG